MPTRRTTCLGAINCPICGRRGQLKICRPHLNYKFLHYAIDHYNRGNNHASGYNHRCYFGTANPKTTIQLFNVSQCLKILDVANKNGLLSEVKP